MKKNNDNANDKEDKGRRFREQYTYTAIHGTQNNIHRMGYLPFHCSTRIFPSPYTGSGNQIKTQYSK